MRLTAPRIKPLDDASMTPEQSAALAAASGGKTAGALNIFRTLAHAPKALERFLSWGGYVLSRRNSLSERDREIVILRIGYLCKSGYEFTQHTRIGLNSGLTEQEIQAIKAGPNAPNWKPNEKALLQASDELNADHFITDATWAALKQHYDDKQCMDVVFTAGQYTQVSMMLNSFGVQLDKGQTLDPDLKGY